MELMEASDISAFVLSADRMPECRVDKFLKTRFEVTACSHDDIMDYLHSAHESFVLYTSKSWKKEREKFFLRQDDFLSIVAHELKTPVTSLALQAQMLERLTSIDSQIHSVQFDRSLAILSRQIEKLQKLVDTLLDASMLRTGKLSLQFEKMDLADWLQDRLDHYARMLVGAHCTLQSFIEPHLKVYADAVRLEQVLSNLISNILKYAPGTPVQISLQRKGDDVELVVADKGPGIPLDRQSCVFGRYERGICDKKVSGLGLGLFVVQEIIQFHHGQIRMESEEGKGTRFVVTLPLATKIQQQEKKQDVDNRQSEIQKDFNH